MMGPQAIYHKLYARSFSKLLRTPDTTTFADIIPNEFRRMTEWAEMHADDARILGNDKRHLSDVLGLMEKENRQEIV